MKCLTKTKIKNKNIQITRSLIIPIVSNQNPFFNLKKKSQSQSLFFFSPLPLLNTI